MARLPNQPLNYARRSCGKYHFENWISSILFCQWPNYAFFQVTDWKLSLRAGKESTAYVSMTNIVYASGGRIQVRSMSKLQIIIEVMISGRKIYD
jgi:hypothetical protein